MALTTTISKVVTAKSADYDLTTLDIVKDELGIDPTNTSNDAFLDRAISQVSSVISNYCQRVFSPEEMVETQQIQQDPYPAQTPGGVAPLQLSRFPLLAVKSVVQIYPISTTQPLVLGTDYSIDYEHGWLIRLNPFTGVAVTWESCPTIIDYVAGFGTITTEAYTVPANPGPYTLTVIQAKLFSIDQGVTYASSGTALTPITTGTPTVGQYKVDPTTGIYTFAAADTGVAILISYAYLQVPLDLVDACLRAVTQRFYSKSRDPLMMAIDQPNVGSKRYWIDTKADMPLPPEITGILTNYRVPVIA